MTSIILNSITGLNYPYDIYVCDVYGNNCGYISQINTPVPASVEIVLPPPFNVAPAGGGGKFLIQNSVGYTSLTISGDGGDTGSLLSICSDSI